MSGVRGIRFSKAERTRLIEWCVASPAGDKVAASIRSKVAAVDGPAPEVQANAPAIQEQLVLYSRGKVIELAVPNWAKFNRMAAYAGATVGDAQTVGAWIAEQPWLTGAITLDGVLAKWSSWLAKARAWAQPSQGPKAGLNGRQGADSTSNVGPNPARPGTPAPGGRPAPGLRRA